MRNKSHRPREKLAQVEERVFVSFLARSKFCSETTRKRLLRRLLILLKVCQPTETSPSAQLDDLSSERIK